MADVKISALPLASTPLAGTEVLPIVQSATTDQVSVANLTAGRAVSAASLTLTTTPLAVGSGGTGLSTLTAGYIPYGNGTSAFNSSSSLYFDGTNLGIGTSSPGAYGKFAVQGLASVVNMISTAAAGICYQSFFSNSGSTNLGYIGFGSANNTDYIIYANQASSKIDFYTSATFAARIDSSGNLGLGVVPPTVSTGKSISVGYSGSNVWSATESGNIFILSNAYFNSGYKYDISGKAASYYQQNSGIHAWFNAPSGTAGNAISFTQAMTLDASGNLGIGIPSPFADTGYRSIDIRGTTGAQFNFGTGSGREGQITSNATNGLVFNTINATPLVFYTYGTERARIDADGVLLINRNALQSGLGATCRLQVRATGADYTTGFENTNATTPYGLYLVYSGASPNNTSSPFANFRDTGGTRFGVRSNGGIENYQANDVNLSDERMKEEIDYAPAYLDKICQIPVRTFKYKDQTHDDLNIGVVAQEVEAIAPELVDADGFGDTPSDGVPYKAIYQTDLQYALMKCIQELAAKVTALEDQING